MNDKIEAVSVLLYEAIEYADSIARTSPSLSEKQNMDRLSAMLNNICDLIDV